MPLGPVRDALADYLLAQAPRQVEANLGAVAADLAWAVPELRYHLNLPGAGDGAGGIRPSSSARTACLRSLADQQSVLLCLEDLHVADAATVDLIRFLGRQIQRLPLVLVCTFRSDEVPLGHLVPAGRGDDPRGWRRDSNLAPLDRGDTAQSIDMSLRPRPASRSAQPCIPRPRAIRCSSSNWC